MKLIKSIVAMAAAMAATVGHAGDSAPFRLDTALPAADSFTISWDASWIGGDSNATVVVRDNGVEVKRTTGSGQFTYSLSSAARHELTYTTYIFGLPQDEVYTATVFKDWKYEVVGGGARITDTTQTSGTVTIPAEIDGYPVTGIGSNAFAGCAGLTGVAIPNSVTNIGSYAFYGCSGLATIAIPQSVRNVGENAFDGCSASLFDTATIPGVKLVDGWAVGYEDSLSGGLDLTGVRGIGDCAFRGCTNLTSVTIPASVTGIGREAFSRCSGLREIWLPERFRNGLDSSVFSGCPADREMLYYCKYAEMLYAQLTAAESSDTNIVLLATNACKVTFQWKCSCEPMRKGQMRDFLSFSIDGVQQDAICGETDWTNCTFYVEGDGEHVLRWTYQKDASGTEGEDCGWVRLVTVAPPVTLSFLPGEATSGAPPASLSFFADEGTVTLPGRGTLAWPKHTFIGWSDGETVHAAGARYPCDADVTELTPAWARKELSAPVIAAPEVFYSTTAAVTITAESGTAIYYTLDGSAPSADGSSSRPYQGAFTVGATTTIRAIAVRDDYFDSPEATATVTKDVTALGAAVNAPSLEFATDAGTGWRFVRDESPDGYALRSGAIGNNATSRIDVVVVGEGTLSFSCKVAGEVLNGTEVYDGLAFLIDGVQQGGLMGNVDWVTNTYEIVGESAHTLSWLYIKDESDEFVMPEDCAWLDEVVWGSTRNVTVTFDANGGVCAEASRIVEYASAIGALPEAERDGHNLVGWFTAADGGDEVTAETVVSGDVTYYAHWEQTSSSVWLYEVVDGNATVTGCVAAVGDMEIPSVLGGHPVTAIGADAFYNCGTLTGIAIPDSVTNIGDQAFYACSRLEWVTLPDGLTDIAENLFRSCGRLAGVVIPDSVTNINIDAFRYCYGLESVVIGSGVVRIGNKSFGSCTNLASVVIPDSVTYIAGSAFEKCRSLSDVTVGRGVATIYIGAFSDCSSLTNLLFLGNAPSIGNNAFTNVAPDCCAHVHYASTGWDVQIPGTWKGIAIDYVHHSVTFDANGGEGGGTAWVADGPGLAPPAATRRNYRLVGWFTAAEGGDEVTAETPITADMTLYAHWELLSATWLYEVVGGTATVTGCVSAVGGIEVPSVIDDYTVTAIGNAAFSNKVGLTSVIIPNGVTSIGTNAFYGCSGLKGITIPDGVTGICRDAFRGCAGLESVALPNSLSAIVENVFRDCSKLECVDFGNGVASIGNKAFSKCRNLTSVAIPGNVRFIDVAAFEYCSGLTNVTIGVGVTNIGKVAFQNCSALKSILFNGNAPATVAANAFTTGVSPDCCAYVYRTSTGWSVEIPGTWKGIAIEYRSETDGIVVDAGGGKSVTVPGAWLGTISGRISAAGGDTLSALAAPAANGRKVWECYVLGLNPDDNSATNDFRITSFPLKADGTPDIENIIFDPPQTRWNVPATYKVKGTANLSDTDWPEVTEGNKANFRFFKVELVLP